MTQHDFYADHEATPERRLMLAVLLLAIQDAAVGSPGTTTERNRSRVRGTALGWIKDAGPDFQSVCELAGLDPVHVRHATLDFIASGKPMPLNKRTSIDRKTRGGRRKRKAPAHA